jgi:signal transduction histidine kinase
MLLTGRAGELTDQQRRLLTEAERSCARLSGIITEMSDLAALEGGSASFNHSALDPGLLLQEAIAALPPLPDREIGVTLTNNAAGARVTGDPTRLRAAFTAVITALRRELVTSPQLAVRVRRENHASQPAIWITIAGDEHIEAVDRASSKELGTFNEWRGGCGLSLAVARRIVAAHDGQLWSPEEDPKAGAVLMLPEAEG